MPDILLSYLVFVPSTIICLFPMKEQLKYSLRRTILTIGLVLISSTLVFSLLEYKTGINENLLIYPLFILYFGFYHGLLTVHVSKSLAVFSSSVALISILSNMAFCLSDILTQVFSAELFFHPYIIQFILSLAVAALFAYPYIRYGSELVSLAGEARIWYTTILISATFFVINMLLLPLVEAAHGDRRLNLCLLAAFGLLLLLLTAIQVRFYFIVTSLREMHLAQERVHILELQESQFVAQQRYIKASERTRHDFRQSIRTLSELYQQEDFSGIGEYLQEYIRQMPEKEVTAYCGNTALNALLNYYVHEAAQSGINFTLNVQIPDMIPVSDIDLCNMIGNILENAITACQKVDDKYIRLSAVAEDGMQLYIVVVNSFDGRVRVRHEQYLSTSHRG